MAKKINNVKELLNIMLSTDNKKKQEKLINKYQHLIESKEETKEEIDNYLEETETEEPEDLEEKIVNKIFEKLNAGASSVGSETTPAQKEPEPTNSSTSNIIAPKEVVTPPVSKVDQALSFINKMKGQK